ncbi:nucleotidyltransferase domain-containing protein [Thermococcus sp. SY098]|uniref:nucleotidyltransferase domain-containing protein n=1 Tax=Thermococcus sp. SY098 TaxID=3111325 RepID=UPI002D76D813|nr:nucleotidyltransferase domain-containing protein [Thermococcus sp. SY098]WRS52815.1 nucleotidyltransferase domain-containing protein [Thermococcus sp. SY098]
MEFLECIKKRIIQDDELKNGLYSLIIYGSFVRGDFLENVSDLDFFAVIIKDESIIPKLKQVLEDCIKEVNAVEVDLAWEYLENIGDPLRKGVPFKFLTIYQEDFLENHIVVYGKDIADVLPKYKFEDLLDWRIERILKLIKRSKGNTKLMHILAGETARLLALINGAKSLRKNDIMNILEKIQDEEAIEIYRAYLDGRKLKFDENFLVRFIESRMTKTKMERQC